MWSWKSHDPTDEDEGNPGECAGNCVLGRALRCSSRWARPRPARRWPTDGRNAAKLSRHAHRVRRRFITGVFTEMGADFERQHKGTTVTFNFAASSALVGQIQGGAPADVFASADGTNMQKVVAAGT